MAVTGTSPETLAKKRKMSLIDGFEGVLTGDSLLNAFNRLNSEAASESTSATIRNTNSLANVSLCDDKGRLFGGYNFGESVLSPAGSGAPMPGTFDIPEIPLLHLNLRETAKEKPAADTNNIDSVSLASLISSSGSPITGTTTTKDSPKPVEPEKVEPAVSKPHKKKLKKAKNAANAANTNTNANTANSNAKDNAEHTDSAKKNSLDFSEDTKLADLAFTKRKKVSPTQHDNKEAPPGSKKHPKASNPPTDPAAHARSRTNNNEQSKTAKHTLKPNEPNNSPPHKVNESHASPIAAFVADVAKIPVSAWGNMTANPRTLLMQNALKTHPKDDQFWKLLRVHTKFLQILLSWFDFDVKSKRFNGMVSILRIIKLLELSRNWLKKFDAGRSFETIFRNSSNPDTRQLAKELDNRLSSLTADEKPLTPAKVRQPSVFGNKDKNPTPGSARNQIPGTSNPVSSKTVSADSTASVPKATTSTLFKQIRTGGNGAPKPAVKITKTTVTRKVSGEKIPIVRVGEKTKAADVTVTSKLTADSSLPPWHLKDLMPGSKNAEHKTADTAKSSTVAAQSTAPGTEGSAKRKRTGENQRDDQPDWAKEHSVKRVKPAVKKSILAVRLSDIDKEGRRYLKGPPRPKKSVRFKSDDELTMVRLFESERHANHYHTASLSELNRNEGSEFKNKQSHNLDDESGGLGKTISDEDIPWYKPKPYDISKLPWVNMASYEGNSVLKYGKQPVLSEEAEIQRKRESLQLPLIMNSAKDIPDNPIELVDNTDVPVECKTIPTFGSVESYMQAEDGSYNPTSEFQAPILKFEPLVGVYNIDAALKKSTSHAVSTGSASSIVGKNELPSSNGASVTAMSDLTSTKKNHEVALEPQNSATETPKKASTGSVNTEELKKVIANLEILKNVGSSTASPLSPQLDLADGSRESSLHPQKVQTNVSKGSFGEKTQQSTDPNLLYIPPSKSGTYLPAPPPPPPPAPAPSLSTQTGTYESSTFGTVPEKQKLGGMGPSLWTMKPHEPRSSTQGFSFSYLKK